MMSDKICPFMDINAMTARQEDNFANCQGECCQLWWFCSGELAKAFKPILEIPDESTEAPPLEL